MQKQEIFDAYESIKPDDAAKRRMLHNIHSSVEFQGLTGKENNMGNNSNYNSYRQGTSKGHRWNTRKACGWAAAAALALIIPVSVYAANALRLESINIGKQAIDIPYSTDETDAGDGINTADIAELGGVADTADVPVREVDMISLQGLAGSPEFEACREWNEFLESYDPDEEILSAVGDEPGGLGEQYNAYLCYTQELADKIDEICEKYQLSKLAGFVIGDDYEDFCQKAGIGDIFGDASGGITHKFECGYCYAGGTFQYDASAEVDGISGEIDYQMRHAGKGYFDAVLLNVEDLLSYEQWDYTTEGGQEVLLANSGSKALIIVEKEDSFTVVNIMKDWLFDPSSLSNEMLQKIADSFDFSAFS